MAIVFVGAVFLIKVRGDRKNEDALSERRAALLYENTTVSELVNEDRNKNGIPDWEENLKSTNSSSSTGGAAVADISGTDSSAETNLTKTDKFSRELLGTVAALNQTGAIDQNTVDTLSSSLADQIKNPIIRKIYKTSDLKIIKDNSSKAVKTYGDALVSIYAKYPTKSNVNDILKEFLGDGNEVNVEALAKLDPIIKQTQSIIDARIKTAVPDQLAELHLDVINAFERLLENISDIKLFDTDPIVAMGAISKYEENTVSLGAAFEALASSIQSKLSN